MGGDEGIRVNRGRWGNAWAAGMRKGKPAGTGPPHAPRPPAPGPSSMLSLLTVPTGARAPVLWPLPPARA